MANTQQQQQAAEMIRSTITTFLDEQPHALLQQSGLTLLSLSMVQYAVDAKYGRCSIQFWSETINLFRTVTAVEKRDGGLRLTIQRLGMTKGSVLWLTPGDAPQPPRERQVLRARYQERLRAVLAAQMLPLLSHPRHNMRTRDVSARAYGAYVRGVVGQGRQKWCFIGVGAHEPADSVNGLTRAGLLWLARYRESATSGGVRGLRIICPPNRAHLLSHRIAWLLGALKVELIEFNEETRELVPISCDRQQLCCPEVWHAFNEHAVLGRSTSALAALLPLLPPGSASQIDVQPLSPTTLSVRLYGLEFARVCYSTKEDSFKLEAMLYATLGRKHTKLVSADSKALFRMKMATLFAQRHSAGVHNSSYYRSGTDSWLVKRVREMLHDIEPSMIASCVYRAFQVKVGRVTDSIDLLCLSQTGRLSIFHIRATENTLFPMHGLDQWIRIREAHRSGALKQAGYFAGLNVADEDPQLFFIAPALRLHKTTERILSYFTPEVEWSFIGVNEHWRDKCTVVYRKGSRRDISFELPVKRPMATVSGNVYAPQAHVLPVA